jgi:hypothetical protein
MKFEDSAPLIAIGLFAAMVLLLSIGKQLGARRLELDPEGARAGVSAVDGAVFGMLGLLIAFTFSGASTRFEARRALVVEEANAIGTAWLRLDLLPSTAQPEMRERFRAYLDSRIEVYHDTTDLAEVNANLARSAALQNGIWAAAVVSCREPGMQRTTILLLPALNQMIDITTTRTMAARFHQPILIFGVLFALASISSLLAGYGMAGSRKQSWVHMIGFAAITSMAIYVILDLEYPRRGLIRIDASDQVLIGLRASMDR